MTDEGDSTRFNNYSELVRDSITVAVDAMNLSLTDEEQEEVALEIDRLIPRKLNPSQSFLFASVLRGIVATCQVSDGTKETTYKHVADLTKLVDHRLSQMVDKHINSTKKVTQIIGEVISTVAQIYNINIEIDEGDFPNLELSGAFSRPSAPDSTQGFCPN